MVYLTTHLANKSQFHFSFFQVDSQNQNLIKSTLTVQLYKCTNVQLYKCTTVQMYNCTNVQM